MTTFEELSFLKGREQEALLAAGFSNALDLLEWLPKRYEDRRRFDAFPAQAGGPPVCLRGTVIDTQRKRFGGKGFYEAIIEDIGGGGFSRMTCRWFNMPFMHKMIAAGHEVVLYGKPKESAGRVVIDHPEFEVVREDALDSIHLECIVPIYKNVSGIPQRRLREIMHATLQGISVDALEPLYNVDVSYPRAEAFREVHFPGELSQTDAARRYFAKEEFFLQQLRVVWRRARSQEMTGRVLGKKTTLLKEFYESLPFDLTGAQKRSVKEIVGDLRVARPMNRLLQGDVGSGKTFVAMCAMLLAVDSGAQAALMAPTQILAEQHYLTFAKWLEPLGLRIGLATADRREEIHDAQIVIGTHALLYDKVEFDDLALVVIDEQHKFGVHQRLALRQKGEDDGFLPHQLVMTATPIPRTLTMSMYADMDCSVIDELPPGRSPITTSVIADSRREEVVSHIEQACSQGAQAYWVCTLIDESEVLQCQAAETTAEQLTATLPDLKIGLVHGRMTPDDKASVMNLFKTGKLNLLVATTVIEVGVDVPNASLMVIDNSERLGLAQLHQLRGRIGRGTNKSFCLLPVSYTHLRAHET